MSTFEGTLTKRAKARVGRVLLDKWRLDRLLGVGGTAAVYEACHRNGQRVAVKMLHAEMAEDPELRERFLREGYVANKVNHPGALAVLDEDIDEEDGSVFLVMELLEGETLNERWRRADKCMDPGEVLYIAAELLGVLEAAHEQEVIHRDIKPENLFLTNDGSLKVLDFGVARCHASLGRLRLTCSGVAIGTPAFMAPEQARGRLELISPCTDLWAVGATMFTLLSGHIVHDAATESEQLLAAMMRPARSLGAVAPAMPAVVVELVDRALAFDPEARYASAASMRDAISSAYRALMAEPIERRARPVPSATAPAALAQAHRAWPSRRPESRRPASRSRTRRFSRTVAWAACAATLTGALVAFAMADDAKTGATPCALATPERNTEAHPAKVFAPQGEDAERARPALVAHEAMARPHARALSEEALLDRRM